MRNVFDQYDQPENKLTHALACTLAKDRKLIIPLLKKIGVKDFPPEAKINIVEQRIPGTPDRDDEGDGDGLPDLCLYSDDGWAVVFEMKVQSPLAAVQLQRHAASMKRAGFESPQLVTVTVDSPTTNLPSGTITTHWRDLYAWFDSQRQRSNWASEFVRYLESFEASAPARNYEIRGTLTMFNGLRFDDRNPYTYREGKRLIRLFRDELRARTDLRDQLGIDPVGKGRSAITEGLGEEGGVWDFLSLTIARDASFTRFPHLTIVLTETSAIAALTVPNGVSGGFQSRLKRLGSEGFLKLVQNVEERLRPITKQSEGSRPAMYAIQRHYRSQRSLPTQDGRISLDLRMVVEANDSGVKYQPEWVEAVYQLLINKRSNIQFGIEMQFSYECEKLQSREATDLFAESWIAMKPFLDFVHSE